MITMYLGNPVPDFCGAGAIELSLMGSPRLIANAKHALKIPGNVATKEFPSKNEFGNGLFFLARASRFLSDPYQPGPRSRCLKAHATPHKGDLSRGMFSDLSMFQRRQRKQCREYRWHQRAESRAITQCDPHSKRHAEITHRQAECQAPNPHSSKKVSPPKRADRLALRTPTHLS